MSLAIDTLTHARYINLETFKKNGDGVKTPVWFAEMGGKLYVFTDGTSYKVKRIVRNSKARVAACNVSGKEILSDWFDGHAIIVHSPDEEERAYKTLRKKYGLQMKLLDIGSKISGRYNRRKMIRISFDEVI